jgi:hypothetical protein
MELRPGTLSSMAINACCGCCRKHHGNGEYYLDASEPEVVGFKVQVALTVFGCMHKSTVPVARQSGKKNAG